jgi:hypothetical protein
VCAQLLRIRCGLSAPDGQHSAESSSLSLAPAANKPPEDSRRSYSDPESFPWDIVPDPADAPPATDPLAWFSSSTPFRERKRHPAPIPAPVPAPRERLRSLARKSIPECFRPAAMAAPSDSDDEPFRSDDETSQEPAQLDPDLARAPRQPRTDPNRHLQREPKAPTNPSTNAAQGFPAPSIPPPPATLLHREPPGSAPLPTNAHLFNSPPRKLQATEFTHFSGAPGVSSTTAHLLRGSSAPGGSAVDHHSHRDPVWPPFQDRAQASQALLPAQLHQTTSA